MILNIHCLSQNASPTIATEQSNPPPKPPPQYPEEERIFSILNWKDYPLAVGCERSENIEKMHNCLEETFLTYIINEFSYTETPQDLRNKEKIIIEYHLDKSMSIREVKMSSISNPKIASELERVLDKLNTEVRKLLHPKKSRDKVYRIKIEHSIEINDLF